MTITKQRVEKIIYRHEMGLNSDVTAEEVYDLAVLALNLSNIANLKRYELDMGGCDSCGQDCGADMTEDSDGDYVLFVDGEVGPNKNVPGLIRGAEICVSIAEQLRKGGNQ